MSTERPQGRAGGSRVRRGTTRGRDRARTRALVLFVVLLVAAGVTVWLIVRSEATGDKTAAPPCAGGSAAASAIRMRVLNATPREGLAASVAAELRKRGYTVTGVGNDTRGVAGTAEVRHGTKGAAAAALIAKTVAAATVRNDARAGTDVDLVLGTKFRALAPVQPGASATGCPSTMTTT